MTIYQYCAVFVFTYMLHFLLPIFFFTWLSCLYFSFVFNPVFTVWHQLFMLYEYENKFLYVLLFWRYRQWESVKFQPLESTQRIFIPLWSEGDILIELKQCNIQYVQWTKRLWINWKETMVSLTKVKKSTLRLVPRTFQLRWQQDCRLTVQIEEKRVLRSARSNNNNSQVADVEVSTADRDGRTHQRWKQSMWAYR